MKSLNEESKSVQNLENRYECHICLEIASEPVLTACGHLFCWPCIYHWLHSNQEFLTCPVCKNGIQLKQLIPIYTKEDDEQANNDRPQKKKKKMNKQFFRQKNRDPNIPLRPKPERQQPKRNQNQLGGSVTYPRYNNLQSGTMLAGYGLFPSIYNLINIQHDDLQNNINNDPSNPVQIFNMLVDQAEELRQMKKIRLAFYLILFLSIVMFLVYF